MIFDSFLCLDTTTLLDWPRHDFGLCQLMILQAMPQQCQDDAWARGCSQQALAERQLFWGQRELNTLGLCRPVSLGLRDDQPASVCAAKGCPSAPWVSVNSAGWLQIAGDCFLMCAAQTTFGEHNPIPGITGKLLLILHMYSVLRLCEVVLPTKWGRRGSALLILRGAPLFCR